MIYPYTGRDFFAEPESYEYAQCDSVNYLKEWRISRSKAEILFARRANELAEHDSTREPTEMPADAVSLHALLQRLIVVEPDRASAVQVLKEIDPFIVKYEVFGRLFAWYRNDGRRHLKSPPAAFGTYLLFAQRLCEIIENIGSLKHLSTLLKLCDALASQPTGRFEPKEARSIVDLLKRENFFVQMVTEAL